MDNKRNLVILLGLALIISIGVAINISSKNMELEKTVQAQANIINELQNGAERRIAEIRGLFANKQFKDLYTASTELSKKHPGTKEAKEAEGYVSQAQVEEAAVLAKQKEEAQRQKELAERSNIDKARSIIRVSKVSTDNPNSAGGVDFRIVWQNTSNKAIKYSYFTVVPYNAVNDIVMCTIRRESEYTGKVTGPVNPGEWYGEEKYWECAWYNNSIERAELKKIEINYMDGTSVRLTGDDIKYVQF